ncbi:MAG: hypothetical protein QUS33_07645 [Dehalococcoidia bacterium]|nr:hypothetical protein [Dehalococcoidia bacterium]
MDLALDITPPALILIYTLLSVVFRWSPQIPLVGAFVLLVITGLTFMFGADGVADHFAFSVFYLLVSGAILLIVSHIRENTRKE